MVFLWTFLISLTTVTSSRLPGKVGVGACHVNDTMDIFVILIVYQVCILYTKRKGVSEQYFIVESCYVKEKTKVRNYL